MQTVTFVYMIIIIIFVYRKTRLHGTGSTVWRVLLYVVIYVINYKYLCVVVIIVGRARRAPPPPVAGIVSSRQIIIIRV